MQRSRPTAKDEAGRREPPARPSAAVLAIAADYVAQRFILFDRLGEALELLRGGYLAGFLTAALGESGAG